MTARSKSKSKIKTKAEAKTPVRVRAKTASKPKTLSRTPKTKTPKAAARAKPAGKAAGEIWRVKIQLVRGMGAKGPWQSTVDLRPSTNLLALHRLIQDLVSFSDDHLFTFFVAANDLSRERVTLEDEWQNARLDLRLETIFPLPKGQKLFYWFDFGDDWHFAITRTAQAPKPPEKGVRYPQVIATKGETPEQYPGIDEE